MYRWHPVADSHALQQSAIAAILTAASEAIERRGRFNIVLAGGNTPRAIYQGLCTAQTEWSAWHIYFGDERCLPPLDPSRNSRMAADVWLDSVPIPPQQIHAIPAELGSHEAAQAYAETVAMADEFDLVLLGVGEDGHTASLFPGKEWGTTPDSPDVLAVFDAPKPPPQRVSLSAARLSRTRQLYFLVSGESKHQAVMALRDGRDIPAQAIRPVTGVDILLESALLDPSKRSS